MQMALEKGVDLASIEKMMDLQEKWERNEARKAYFAAVADFKKDPPKIIKDQAVNYNTAKGKTSYNHASLGNVTLLTSVALGEHGLSSSFKQAQAGNGQLTITCTLTHRLGYSESTSLTAPPDSSGGKNGIQAIGSTNSYLERYTLLAILGLATHDMDDDGRGNEPKLVKTINERQQGQILDMMNSKSVDQADFLGNYLKVASVEMIPVSMFASAMADLEAVKVAQ